VLVLTAGLGGQQARSESVDVKYRGMVNLAPFSCSDVERSSFIKRVCYDASNQYMLISLNGTYYHYCAIDADTVSSLLSAPSMGRFFNSEIKGRFDCRVNRVPSYLDQQSKM
jgi:KTSC domain